VYSIAFSPDDVFIASGTMDTRVKVWDVQTGALVTTLGGHTSTVSSVSFSPTGAMIASGADDGTV
jgi:WD40 repeat protein